MDVANTIEFRDVKTLRLNATKLLANFTYGFKYEGKPVDIVDNEFVWIQFKYEEKVTEFEKRSTDLGVTPCLEKSHLNDYFTKAEITKKFGNVYCIDPNREYFI